MENRLFMEPVWRAFAVRIAVFRWKAFGALAAVAISLPALVGAQEPLEFDRGRALYENHCQGCHEALAHTRADREVKSIAGLRARVSSWSVHSGLNWTDDEIDDVARYLNRRFYQITP
jgi:mono/diheme cytochrome c family protein